MLYRITALLLVVSCSACANFNQAQNLTTLKQPSVTASTPFTSKTNKATSNIEIPHQTETLGLALGGGGVRGFVHMGVFKALEEHGIKANVVVGTSAGSIAASYYAAGLSYKQMVPIVESLSEWQLADVRINKNGFLKGEALADWINDNTPQKNIEDMPIPLGIAVTNLSKNQVEIITQGNVGKAVQISSSIPGAFIPTELKGDIYVDGGVMSVVPVKGAKQLGADRVIAVDIFCHNIHYDKDKSVLVAATRLQSCLISEPEIQMADIVIRPDYEPENAGRFGDKQKAIDAGYQATIKAMPEIKAMLKSI